MTNSIEAIDFIAKFNALGKPLSLKDYVVRGQVNLNTDTFKCCYATISNVLFTEGVFFDDANLGIGIRFSSCTFKKNISFNRCHASGIDQKFNFDSHSIYFEGCTINELTFPTQNVIERGIKVFKNSKIGNLQIENIHIALGSIDIEESEVAEKLDLFYSQIREAGTIRIYNSTIKSSVRITGVLAGSISFVKSKFERNIHIWGGELKNRPAGK